MVMDFVAHKVGNAERREEEVEMLKRELLAMIQAGVKTADLSVENIPEERMKRLQSVFLMQLRYNAMEDRGLQIAKAHQNTFQWIFGKNPFREKKWRSFATWLESDSQLYWITGKAGSGKSTLMKFIGQYEGPETASSSVLRPKLYLRLLRKWAGDAPLVTAFFYFWASGSSIEASQRGLHLSLLSQILSQCRNSIPMVFPRAWEALCLLDVTVEQHTDDELRQMLQDTIAYLHAEHKLCLFIDGLDEFDGNADNLIQLLKGFRTYPNVKLCVASRPWMAFETAFKEYPSIMIQDLTYSDMRTFVNDKFNASDGFKRLRDREPDFADGLMDAITSKAAGVFLWVSLVVDSLLIGMRNDDRISDFQLRLDKLPDSLERLYDTILDNLEPEYRQHAAQYFKLMQDRPVLPALMFSFADEDEDFAMKLAVSPLEEEKVTERVETVRRRINSRCKGLLEILESAVQASDPRRITSHKSVTYLHTTVKEYMEEKLKPGERLGAMVVNFDSSLRLCAATLATLKTANEKASVTDLESTIVSCVVHARQVFRENNPKMLQLLDEAHRSVFTLSTSGRFPTNDPFSHFIDTVSYSTPYVDERRRYEPPEIRFLSIVVLYGVKAYVDARASKLLPEHQQRGALDINSGAAKISRLSASFRLGHTSHSSPAQAHRNPGERGRSPLWDAIHSRLDPDGGIVSTLLNEGASWESVCSDINDEEKLTIWEEVVARYIIMGCFAKSDVISGWGTSYDPVWLRRLERVIHTFFAKGAKLDRKSFRTTWRIACARQQHIGDPKGPPDGLYEHILRMRFPSYARESTDEDWPPHLIVPLRPPSYADESLVVSVVGRLRRRYKGGHSLTLRPR
jgi:hypothetical protein